MCGFVHKVSYAWQQLCANLLQAIAIICFLCECTSECVSICLVHSVCAVANWMCLCCRDRQEKGEELLELLDRKTAREQEKLQRYQTGGAAVREYCPYLTKEACREARGKPHACQKLHQR